MHDDQAKTICNSGPVHLLQGYVRDSMQLSDSRTAQERSTKGLAWAFLGLI